MNREVVLALVNLLDPLGLFEICPKDEYEDIAMQICDMLNKPDNDLQIETYLKSLYINDKYVEERKVHEFIRILTLLK